MGVLDFVSENGQLAGGQRKWQTDSLLPGVLETMGHKQIPRPLRGSCPRYNAKVKMLKVIMLRFPSWSRYLHEHLFKKKGR